MANVQQSNTSTKQTGSTSVGSPLSNEAYNIITALQAKLEGLEAYRKFAQDGNEEVWQRLMPLEIEAVSLLVDELEQLVEDDKLRVQSRSTGH